MECGSCHAELADGAKYCPKCGEPVKRSRKRFRGVVVLVLIVLLAALLISLALIPAPVTDGEQDAELREDIVAVIDAESSDALISLKQVREELGERGFGKAEVEANYDLKGNAIAGNELKADSEVVYPLYNAYYYAPGEKLWAIYNCNGSFMANPVFAYESGKRPILVIEDEHVTSYSCNDNQFIISDPNEKDVAIIHVDRIDSSTLDSINLEDIELS